MANKYKNVLLIGATGLLGQAIAHALSKRNYVYLAPDSEEFDVTDQELMSEYIRHKWPDLIINCSSIPDVEENENDMEILPELVNFYGPSVLAYICEDIGIPVVHFSSSYVFDGKKAGAYTEQDSAKPLNRYGVFKAGADEAMLFDARELSLVIRTSWLFGAGRTNFVSFVARKAQVGEPIEVTPDIRSNPTYSEDLADATLELIERGARGLVNVVNSGATSRVEMAKIVLSSAKLKGKLVEMPADEVHIATRPPNAVLSTNLLDEKYGIKMRPWKAALADYITTHLKDDILLSDDIVSAERI